MQGVIGIQIMSIYDWKTITAGEERGYLMDRAAVKATRDEVRYTVKGEWYKSHGVWDTPDFILWSLHRTHKVGLLS